MGRVQSVNTTDFADAIRLGCRTMCRTFNADDRDMPMFNVVVRPEARISGSLESHVPGRHLNALLNAEDAVGVPIDEDGIQKHARAAFFSYSGPLALPLRRVEIEGEGPPVRLSPHDIREGFHALYALVKFRHCARARELAEVSIADILRYWDAVRGWNYDGLEEQGLVVSKKSTFITGVARSIGPLVKYYRATGYGPALELAIVLKEKAIDGFFAEDGVYDADVHGTHCHSTTCVMSSLAQLADVTSDSQLVNRVKAFYDRGLWKIRDALGWSPESSGPRANPDRGEVNNTGDILETALILGRWGYTQYYHDAERILRGHLLPSQLRDVSFIEDPPNPEGVDGKRDVADRLLGAFGLPAPYGHEPLDVPAAERSKDRLAGIVKFNTDLVGGAVGSLCEAYREVARFDEAGHRVNLLFDHETHAIKVESPYTHGVLRIRLKRPGPLFVRIPPWLEAESMSVQGASCRVVSGYLLIPDAPVNRQISLEFPLASSEIVLDHRTRKIRVRLRGDEVVAMDNFGADLTYFDSLD